MQKKKKTILIPKLSLNIHPCKERLIPDGEREYVYIHLCIPILIELTDIWCPIATNIIPTYIQYICMYIFTMLVC